MSHIQIRNHAEVPRVTGYDCIAQLQRRDADEQVLERNRDTFGLLFAVDLPGQQRGLRR